MAHEITITEGAAEMAYVGEKPWHGLGQRLEEGAPVEVWQKAAGMQWGIRKVPLSYYGDRAQTTMLTVPGQVGLIRSDSASLLGIVSETYQVVQPREVLEFFRDLVGGVGMQLHTAGTLFGGQRYWALAKMGEATIAGWDKVGGFLLLATSADGSSATEVRETSVRVVCNNTLALARASAGNTLRVSHRQSFNAAKVKSALGLSSEKFSTFMDTADRLTRIRVTAAAAEAFVGRLLAPETGAEAALRRPKGMDTILALFGGAGRGADQLGSAGTAWGLVNAVTEYVDHYSTAKTPSHALAKSLFGTSDDLKSRALADAVSDYL